MGKLGMIGWLGLSRRASWQVWPSRGTAERAQTETMRALMRSEAGKIRWSERGSPVFLSALVAVWLVGCRCDGERAVTVTAEDCNVACAASTSCPGSDPADCASRCQDLVRRGQAAHASTELAELMKCVKSHPCAPVFSGVPGDACGAALRGVMGRIAACAPGAVQASSVERGTLMTESLGCVGIEACVPALDAGASGGPCQTASTCNAACCACGGRRTWRARACIAGECASQAQACELVATHPDCRVE